MKIMVAYDGSLNSKTALKYAIQKVKVDTGELIVLHVFDRSIFVDYDAGPGAEQMARIESARYVEDARRMLEEAGGIKSRIIVEEGDPADEIVHLAHREAVDVVFSPPRYRAVAGKTPCPVSIIPGYIVVPLDNTEVPTATLDRISDEAKSTNSQVILLGIVPVHIYNKWEKKELEKIKRETSSLIKQVKNSLKERAVVTKEIIHSGYPDEEIMRVADQYPVTMIIMPMGGDAPSELGKAAAILSDRESGIPSRPFVLMPSA
jgi:nucleotide-binding universal stress UspA family protein